MHLAAYKIPRYTDALDALLINSAGSENVMKASIEQTAGGLPGAVELQARLEGPGRARGCGVPQPNRSLSCCTQASAVRSAVRSCTSAASGVSYGLSIPVKFRSSPRRALA